MTISAKVFDAANATELGDLYTGVWGPVSATAQERIDDIGKGDVRLPDGHPTSDQCDYRNVVRLSDGENAGAFTIQTRDWVEIAQMPQSRRNLTLTGPGLLDRWNDFIVLPWVPITQRPISLTRIFNYASPGLDASAWSSTIFQHTRSTSDPQRPIAMPEPVSAWVYPRAESSSQPLEEVVVRREFSLGSATEMVFFCTADDQFRSWVDGVELQSQTPEYPADVWWYTWRSAVRLPAGNHVFSMMCRNQGGPSALIASAWPTDGGGLVGPPIFVTGAEDANPYVGEWLCAIHRSAGSGVTFTGFTPGEICRIPLAEAQGRDCVPEISLDFDDEVDSDGTPWARIAEISMRVGSPGGDILEGLAPWAEFAVDPTADGVVTRGFAKPSGRGGPSGIDLEQGVNLRYLAHRGEV